MDNLMGTLSTGGGIGGTRELANWQPFCDVSETDKNFIIQAELPGVKKEDIKVELDNNMLRISGEKKHEKKEEGETWRRCERTYGKFERSLSVPEGVTEKDIRANYDNGVLKVEFPKPAKAVGAKKAIPITQGK